MEYSRMALEAYWRTLQIDKVTTDDDKPTPVYRLDEIADIIRAAPIILVQEMVEYTFRRLNHRSPRVKQKTLRFIKYTVGKSGRDFKRELQRQSEKIRQLFHYKGTVDPLRGDGLNKAVRDTAHEAITAIFASDEKLSALEETNKRMEGFGSMNFDTSTKSKKSLLNGVVDFGSASIRQGLTMISDYSSGGNPGSENSFFGSYRGKSLTSEQEIFGRLDEEDLEDSQVLLAVPDPRIRPSAFESRREEGSNGSADLYKGNGFSQEERLLDTVTAPGGVRLHPARESLQTFLASALELDPTTLGHALQYKLQAHSWQVRLKAMCVLEAILQQKDQSFSETVAALFEEDAASLYECLKSPQTSLREKAKKVFSLLGTMSKQESEEKLEGTTNIPVMIGNTPSSAMEMPDLIDTNDPDILRDMDNLSDAPASGLEGVLRTVATQASHELDYSLGLYSDTWETNLDTAAVDPFAGVPLASSITGDLFSGLSIDDGRQASIGAVGGLSKDADDLFGGMSLENGDSAFSQQSLARTESLADLMRSTSMNNSTSSSSIRKVVSGDTSGFSKACSTQASLRANSFPVGNVGNTSNRQMMYLNASLMLPMGKVGGFQPTMLFSQNFASEGVAFGGVGNALVQQQLPAGMAGLQRLGVNMGNSGSFQGNRGPGIGLGASVSDSFDFSSNPTSKYTSATKITKEETKAFDFISEHLCAAQGLKKATISV